MKTTKLLSCLGTLLLMAWGLVPTQAAIVRPMPADEAMVSEGLTAHGHAELKVKPDIATFTVSVTTQAEGQAAAAQDNARRTTTLLASLKAGGVADKDIQTQSYDVQPQYDYKPSPPVLTGFQVTNSVEVTVRELGKAGILLDKATQSGATNVSGLSFDLADRTAAERQALGLAVAEAQAKADAMARAAGVGRGRLLSLAEGSPLVVQPLFQPRMMAAAAPEPSTPVEANEITVTADVMAVYAIGAGG